jgi:hypothetical protein
MSRTAGGPIGAALAKVLAETIIKAKQVTVDHEHQARIRANMSWAEHIEGILRPFVAGLVGKLLELDELPDGIRAVLEQASEPTHDADVWLQLLSVAGVITSVLFGLGSIETQQVRNLIYSQYTDVPIPAADLADMVVRGVLDIGDASTEAALTGWNEQRFGLLFENAGEPPGVVDMLGLWRRGLMTDAQLAAGVGFSRIRTDYLPFLQLMAYQTMGTADAIEGALKGVLTDQQAETLFDQAGGLDAQFQTLLDIAGDAIGVEAAGNLYNHGLITEDQLAQVILHSRINPIFEPMAELLRFKWLGVYQISEALKAGTATTQQATEWLLQDGYPADQVTAFVQGSATTKSAGAKALTEAQIVEASQVGLLSVADATTELQSLGYSPTEASWLLSLESRKKEIQVAAGALSIIKRDFIAGTIDQTKATTLMDSAGIDSGVRDSYIAVWTTEKSLTVKTLSAAEVGDIAKKGGFTYDEAIKRWVAMGYAQGDAELLALNYGGPAPSGSPAAKSS